MPNFLKYAGIAQLVERNLAKVEVASSSLVSRSKHLKEVPTSFNKLGKHLLPFFVVVAFIEAIRSNAGLYGPSIRNF